MTHVLNTKAFCLQIDRPTDHNVTLLNFFHPSNLVNTKGVPDNFSKTSTFFMIL